jgi:hypothetical protein
VAIDAAARPRLGVISFVHRFGSALNHHVHLHVCATDGVFVPAAGGAGCCAPPAFLPVRPITQADLATVTERVRCHVIRFLQARSPARRFCGSRHVRLGEQRVFHRRFSCGSRSIERDVPSYFQSLEHLLRYCARPLFAIERLSVTRDAAAQASAQVSRGDCT